MSCGHLLWEVEQRGWLGGALGQTQGTPQGLHLPACLRAVLPRSSWRKLLAKSRATLTLLNRQTSTWWYGTKKKRERERQQAGYWHETCSTVKTEPGFVGRWFCEIKMFQEKYNATVSLHYLPHYYSLCIKTQAFAHLQIYMLIMTHYMSH